MESCHFTLCFLPYSSDGGGRGRSGESEMCVCTVVKGGKLTFVFCLLCYVPTDTKHVLLDLVLTTNPFTDETDRGEMTGQRSPA